MQGELTQAEVEERAEAEKPKARQRKEVRPSPEALKSGALRCGVLGWTCVALP